MPEKTDGKRALLLLLGFALLCAFISCFFFTMSQPGYWHYMDIGAYLSRSFFAAERGFFSEVPYWNYGYHHYPFEVYPPLFFAATAAMHGAFALAGFDSVYWSFFAAFLLSYAFAFAMAFKLSRKSALAYLLTMGNFFSLGLLVLIGFNTKIFAFNICFPAMVYLLDRRKSLNLGKKSLAGFSVLLPALFASHFFLFIVFSIFYLGILLQNKKALLRGLVPFVFVPILTLPYFISFFSSLSGSMSTTAVPASLIGMAFNYYTAIFVLFMALSIIVREWFLAPLALISALGALNLNAVFPILANLELHAAALFFLGIISYYAVNFDFIGAITGRGAKAKGPAWAKGGKAKRAPAGFRLKPPAWLTRERALFALLFFLLLFNFAYFPKRIEAVNLFNNPDYRPLLEYGELKGVFLAADLDGKDRFIMPYVSYQTFNFHNYSVNDWFPVGRSYSEFKADRDKIVEAMKSGDCAEFSRMIQKMRLETIVVKNLQGGFSCGFRTIFDAGKFKVLEV